MKLPGIAPALLIGALSACGLMPPTTIDMPLEAQQHCGFPDGTTLLFAREGVTLQELGLAPADPNPLANPRGTVYVSAEPVPLPGTTSVRAWCMVREDASVSQGAVSDDWTPP